MRKAGVERGEGERRELSKQNIYASSPSAVEASDKRGTAKQANVLPLLSSLPAPSRPLPCHVM